MKAIFSDKIRKDYRVYLEPVLATASKHQALSVNCKTMSRYIRRAVIMQLIRDGYPLGSVSKKFIKYQEVIQRRYVK
jgi:hypothetical protein